MGKDMISCDGRFGGLFHRKCVGYDEAEMAAEADFWLCAACECLGDAEYIPLEEIEECLISGNNGKALDKAVLLALADVPLQSFKRGFETRRAIMNKIVEAEGGNSYKMHGAGRRRNESAE